VIHASSVAVSREHRRAKTDRLDTEFAEAGGSWGGCAGERGHCTMAARPDHCRRGRQAAQPGARVPSRGAHAHRQPNEGHPGPAGHSQLQNQPCARRRSVLQHYRHREGSALPPNVSAELQRDIARLGFVISQIKEIEEARQERLEQEPETGPHAMVRHLARVVGVGIETADMLVNEVLSRPIA